ncbi:hypothetical protein PV11_00778 [Exophiala sideris]|uniref:Uncharacterized protein n=1 Tax=Exophiala sideris TaxID=1016849 RepID=A0A0D1YQN7_9EURO|nr:hypothetical protein PV11_00778 [Exophiala sideris]
MALNAASHNITGDPTGSPSGPPPPVSSDIASTAKEAAKNDALGNNVGGKDEQNNEDGQTVMGMSGKPKTAKESKNENAEQPH